MLTYWWFICKYNSKSKLNMNIFFDTEIDTDRCIVPSVSIWYNKYFAYYMYININEIFGFKDDTDNIVDYDILVLMIILIKIK